MKKSILFLATLLCTLAASATIHNVSSSFSWWVAGTDSPVQAGDTLLVADGEYVEQWSIDFQKSDLVVMAAEGAKPVIKASSYLKIHATTTFEGITFDGLNTATYAIGSRGTEEKNLTLKNCEFKNFKESNICIYENTTLTTLDIDSCVFDGTSTTPVAIYGQGIVTQTTIQDSEFKNYTEYCIYANDYYGARFDKLTIDKCLFHDCTYSAVYLADAEDGLEKQSCSDFTLTNSTIYNVGDDPEGEDVPQRAVVEIRKNSSVASEQKVLIDHITIYNFPAPDYCGAFKVDQTNNTTISNCIAMNPDNIYSKWINPFVISAGATISNSVYFNCGYLDNGATQSNLVKADPMFVDAANGNFQLYAESPAIGLGDPRWGVKAGLQPGSGKLKAAVNAAQAGATIELGDGVYEEPSSIDFNKEGLIIKAVEGTKPVVKASSYLKHNATTTFIGITFDGQDVAEYTTYSYKTDIEKDLTFINCVFKNYTKSCVTIGDGEANVRNLLVDGCTFDGGSKTPAAIKSSGIISACDIKDSEIKGYTASCVTISSSSTSVNNLLIDGCTFDGGSKTLAAVQSSGIINTCEIKDSEIKGFTEYGFVANSSSAHTEELSIDNCIIHDCGYAAVYVCKASDSSEKQSCSDFKLTNSTIYNVGNNTQDHGAVDIRDNANIASTQEVLIDHVTLYNFNTKDWYGGFMIFQSANATISNCIAMNPADLTGKNGYHIYGNAVVSNSLYFNCQVISGAQQTDNINADPLFVNATNNDFMLGANSPAVGKGTNNSNLGDQRWGVSAMLKGKVINITPGQNKLNSAVSSANICDTIVLADGTYEEQYSFDFDKEGLVVMAAENAKPVVKNTDENASFDLYATTTFKGITFDAGNVAQYIMASKGADGGTYTFKDCEFMNWTYWAISNQFETGSHVDSVIVDNCLFHDGLGSAIRFSGTAPEGEHACNYFKMTNSTIYNVVSTEYAAVVELDANGKAEGGQNEVTIDHITLYNYDAADLGAIYVAKTSNLSITNSIIATPEDKGQRALYVYGGTVDNTIHYNGSKRSGNTVYTKCENVDPLFVDAANNNFKLKANSPAIGKATDGSNLGDPRWGVEEVKLSAGDNSAIINAYVNETINVTLERTFEANTGYYTLCVPFDMEASVIGEAYKLDKITENTAEGIKIGLSKVSTIEAGVPYLIKPKTLTNPVIENVTIVNTNGSSYTITGANTNIEFTGIINGSGQTNGSNEYYVGNGGYLYNATVNKLGLRAFFTITDASGQAVTNIRARVVESENEATGLDNISTGVKAVKTIENGQLIIIRNGEKYNVQGQLIK